MYNIYVGKKGLKKKERKKNNNNNSKIKTLYYSFIT